MSNDTPSRNTPLHTWRHPVGWGLAGVVAGGVLVGTLSAHAASTPSPSPTGPAVSAAAECHWGGHGPRRPATAADAAKVKAAVLAKYAGATVHAVEVEGAGFEAHVTTNAGQRLRIVLDKAFAITGTEQGRGGPGGPRGLGGPRGHGNLDPAHEAAESQERAAQEKANDATLPPASPIPSG